VTWLPKLQNASVAKVAEAILPRHSDRRSGKRTAESIVARQSERALTFARWVFRGAGIYGLLALLPHYFIEGQVGRDYPPPITHPEYFYGFVGVAVAWQLAFLCIGQDPARYRLIMLPAFLEKLSFSSAVLVLYLQRRVSGPVSGFALLDFSLGVLFLIAYWRLRESPAT
jgi:hypothetical protein